MKSATATAVSRIVTGGFAVLALAFAACNKKPEKPQTVGDGKVDFTRDIKPLLSSTCLPCHHSETLLGGLNLESRKTAFGGGDGGAFIIPGDPDASLIYVVTENPHGKRAAFEKMPAMKDIFLSDDERNLLKRWIKQGADWPEGAEGWLKPLKIDRGAS